VRYDQAELNAATPFGVAAQATIERLCGQMMANLEGTRLGEDIEALHDMRVASRRLRAALKIFQACFPKDAHADVADGVGTVTRALGQVRDQDVLLDFIKGYAAKASTDQLDWLVHREEQLREDARLRMLDSLADLEKSNLAGRIAALLDRAGMTSTEGKRGAKRQFWAQASELVKAKLDKLMGISHAMNDPDAVAELHQMRIEAKRLRYTMEAFVPCFGKPLSEAVSVVKTIQEQLGQIHDCDVWVEKLRLYKIDPGLSAHSIIALDSLIDDRVLLRRETYEQAAAHWKSLDAKQWAKSITKLVSSPPREAIDPSTEVTDMVPNKAENAEPVRRLRDARGRFISRGGQEGKPAAAKPAKAKAPAAPAAVTGAKAALATAVSRTTSGDGDSPKLLKQLEKMESVLEKLPKQMQGLKYKGALKTEKRLAELSDLLALVPAEGGLSAKKADKLRQDVKSLRQKLAGALKK